MESTKCETTFTNVENGLPEKDGKYKVIAKTESKWNGGIFITLVDFRNGKWIPKPGYCELRVLSWAMADNI